MSEHAYASLNKRIETVWAAVAPEMVPNPAGPAGPPVKRWPFLVGKPRPPATLPPECLRVWWFTFGRPNPEVPGEMTARLQLDIYTDKSDQLLAMRKAKALTDGLGWTPNAPFVPLPALDYTVTPPRLIGRMRMLIRGAEWLDIPDPNPTAIHLALRFEVAWAY